MWISSSQLTTSAVTELFCALQSLSGHFLPIRLNPESTSCTCMELTVSFHSSGHAQAIKPGVISLPIIFTLHSTSSSQTRKQGAVKTQRTKCFSAALSCFGFGPKSDRSTAMRGEQQQQQ